MHGQPPNKRDCNVREFRWTPAVRGEGLVDTNNTAHYEELLFTEAIVTMRYSICPTSVVDNDGVSLANAERRY